MKESYVLNREGEHCTCWCSGGHLLVVADESDQEDGEVTPAQSVNEHHAVVSLLPIHQFLLIYN